MRHRHLLCVICWLMLICWSGSGCSKGGDGDNTTPPPEEENLRISTDASPLNIAAGPSFSVVLSVDSKMPPDGVRIEYSLVGETDGQVYPQGPAFDTKTAKTTINFQSLPRQKFCLGRISVISKTKPSNSASANLRIVYK